MKPVVLAILDGWGIRNSKKGNAIVLAQTLFYDHLLSTCPHTSLEASGKAVGLPAGFQGNSEVGHMTIGAGRILPEMLSVINAAIRNKSFFKNTAIRKALAFTKKHNGDLHIMGLLQDQGVHAYDKHLYALLNYVSGKRDSFKELYIHPFTDGRDTPPKSCMSYLRTLEKEMRRYEIGKIGTIMGRYYAMDRDHRWARTKKAYECLMGKGRKVPSVIDAITKSYMKKETDEFITPSVIGDFPGIKNGDAVIFFNYRFDRARQLTHAFVKYGFKEFSRKKKNIWFTVFSPYDSGLKNLKNVSIAFEPKKVKHILGEILAKQKLKQLRVAETEKYAHVTYFFNQEDEKEFPDEDRILVPSPRVPTYDEVPAMSAKPITEQVINALGDYDVIICNFANADMLGHTGNLGAAVAAVEVLDICMQQIAEAVRDYGGVLLITADHGNAEEMLDSKGKKETSHTLNKVPFIIYNYECSLNQGGGLADVAPTILDILDIQKPKEMTGRSLIIRK